MNDIMIMVLLTLAPFLELRAGIPYGIFATDLHWSVVFLVCIAANMLIGPAAYFLLDRVVHFFFFIGWFHRLYQKYVERTQRKIHPYVEKYGILGVAIFIGVPLPGTGVYSGAVGSYVLGLGYKKFIIAEIIGVLIAGIIILLISLFGNSAWGMFIKMIY